MIKTKNQSPDDIKVFISLTKTVSPFDGDIYIVPSSDGWNDFGFRIRVELGVVDDSKKITWLPAYLAIKEENDTTFYLKKILRTKEKSSLLSIANLDAPYAFLLFDDKQYNILKNILGQTKTTSVLNLLNDISLINFNKMEVPGWVEFFDSQVFNLAISRASESYFAFRRAAAAITTGNMREDQDASKKFSVRIKKNAPQVAFSFDFDLNSLLRGRIAVIIGKNGTGKTSSLGQIAQGLADSEYKNVQFSDRPDINQVIAFVHPSTLKLFKPRLFKLKSAAVRVFTSSSNYQISKRDGVAQLLIDIARSHDNEGNHLRFLLPLLNDALPGIEIYVPVKDSATADYLDKSGRKYSKIKTLLRSGEKNRLEATSKIDHNRNVLFMNIELQPRKLSLGQFSFLQFALNALSNAGPASIFLIDEPENFLHPNLISQFMRLLNRILEGTRSIAIIATHSPFVVREVESRQVHVICQLNNETVVTHPRLNTLGANVGIISKDVFGDDLPTHLYEELLKRENLSNLTFDEVINKYSDILSTEALMFLRGRIDK